MATLILDSNQLQALTTFFDHLKRFAGLADWAFPPQLGANIGAILAGTQNLASYTTAQRDALSAQAGAIIWNSNNTRVEFYNGSAWGPIDTSGSGTVSNVVTGNGLQGGPITTTGTVDLRLNAGGGLTKTLGGGSNELGVDSAIVATLSGSQMLTSKTLTAPIINGASSASGNFDLSGSNGSQKSTTGAQTWNGSSYSFNTSFTSLLGWSLVNWCKNSSGISDTPMTDATVGMKFQAMTAITVTGIRFYWPGGVGALTIRVRLYDAGGVSVRTVDVAVNAAGIYSGSFAPWIINTANTYRDYWATMYETTGTYYARTTDVTSHPGAGDATAELSTTSFIASPFLYILRNGDYAVGDNAPNTNSTTQYFPVEPIFTVP